MPLVKDLLIAPEAFLVELTPLGPFSTALGFGFIFE